MNPINDLLAEPHLVVAATVVIVGIVARSWFSLRKVDTHERFRTSRLEKALEDSSPRERPEIIRALSRLEDRTDTAAGDTERDTDTLSAAPSERQVFAGLQRLWRNLPSAKDQ